MQNDEMSESASGITSSLDNADNSVGEMEEEQQEDIEQVNKDHKQEQSFIICTTESLEIEAEAVEQGIQTEQSVMINASVQTEYSLESILYLEKQNKELKRKLQEEKFGVNISQGRVVPRRKKSRVVPCPHLL